MIEDMETNPDGLHIKYKITSISGEPTDPQAVYFVLRLDEVGRDIAHIKACRIAAKAYAQAVEDTHLHSVGYELKVLVDNLEKA